MATILLIEDDQALGHGTAATLRRAGFWPTWWTDATRLFDPDPIDYGLFIVDLMLPEVSGFEALTRIRDHSDAPVIVLSARTEPTDKVRALQLGADDYMTKPYWPDELVERVRARLRRPLLSANDQLTHGGLAIDLGRRIVRFREHAVPLTPVEYELLVVLARRGGMASTRRQLTSAVLRPPDERDDRLLDSHVSRLRRKLARVGAVDLIETVWGIGYRLREARP